MRKIENECVGCKDVGLHCLGFGCPHRNVTHFYCDRCGEEATLYNYYGEEICDECLLKEFDVVEGSEKW